MRSIAVFTAAVLATVVSPANAEKLKLRCENPLVPSASSTLYIDEVNGRITQIWDSTGYEETSPATFKDGVWRWLGWRTRESDGVIDISLDRRTGETFGTTPRGSSCHSGRFVVDITILRQRIRAISRFISTSTSGSRGSSSSRPRKSQRSVISDP